MHKILTSWKLIPRSLNGIAINLMKDIKIAMRNLLCTMLRFLWLYAAIPYLAVTIIFAVLQRKLMYQPTTAKNLSTTACNLPPESARDIVITAADGVKLKGWLIFASPLEPGGGVQLQRNLVLYFPGNAGNRFQRLDDLREIAGLGFDVLIADYRGYGDSEGRPSQSALQSDARLVWQYACTQLNYAPQRIVIFGESLGGAVALSLCPHDSSHHPRPAAVLLNSTFAKMSDVVAWHYPWFPFRYLLLDRWPSVDCMCQTQIPVVIFHGTADEIVPYSQAQKLAAASPLARLIKIEGGSHNGLPFDHLRTELLRLRTP